MYIFLFIAALIYSCLSEAQIPHQSPSSRGHRDLFSEVEQSMNYALERHKILSENIASQDIPGYRAKNLGQNPTFNQRKSLNFNMHTTSSKHIAPKNITRKLKVNRDKYNTQTTFRKNNVDLSDQMVKVNQNLNDYNLSTSIYKKMHGLLKMAAGK